MGGFFLEGGMALDTNSLLAMLAASGTGARAVTPEALNAVRAGQRSTDLNAWTTERNNAYNTRRNDIQQQFADLGMPDAAAPYLAALQNDYNSLQYHPGTDYSYDPANPGHSNAWDEQGYLAAHPDVAANIQAANSNPRTVSDPNYWHSALDFYNAIGKSSPGYVVPGYGQPDVSPGLLGGTPDTSDDPSLLGTKDYGVSQYVNNVRLGRKNEALSNAENTFQSRLQSMGLSPSDYQTLLGQGQQKFTSLANAAGTSANDYSGVFDPNAVYDAVTGAERTGRRNTYTTQTKAAFSGLDPNTALSDTADDKYISDIVGRSYNDAFGAVDRAYKRGALTDTGYKAGLAELGNERSAADSTAQTLGGAVLTRDRGTLSGIRDSALTDAGGWDFGQTYDPSKYTQQYNDKLGSITSGLGGEIASALQGQNFFDVGSVLNKAGYAQGAQNTNPLTDGYTTPAGALAASVKDKNKDQTRGLGGVGTF